MTYASSSLLALRAAFSSTLQKTKFHIAPPIILILCGLLSSSCSSVANTQAATSQIDAAEFNQQVRSFLQTEVTAHVEDIKSLDPPPDRVVGALTTGEFSWGSFMRALGVYSECFATKTIAGHDIPEMIGKMAEIELSHGGKTWAQLYAAMALAEFWDGLESQRIVAGNDDPAARRVSEVARPCPFLR